MTVKSGSWFSRDFGHQHRYQGNDGDRVAAHRGAVRPGDRAPRVSVLATIADIAAGSLVQPVLLPHIPLTIDLDVRRHDLGAVGDLTATARAIKRGQNVQVYRGHFHRRHHADQIVALSCVSFMKSPAPSEFWTGRTADFSGVGGNMARPFADQIGAVVVAPGEVTLDRWSYVLQPTGTIQGGAVTLLAELAAESALGLPVIDIAVHFLSAVRAGPARATAHRLGRAGPGWTSATRATAAGWWPRRSPAAPRSRRRPAQSRMTAGRDQPADVVIVGAGASGAVAALHLAGPASRWSAWNRAVGTTPASTAAPVRGLGAGGPQAVVLGSQRAGQPGGLPHRRLELGHVAGMFNGVGAAPSSTTPCGRGLTPGDFRVRSEDGVADDWPITYEELLPYLRGDRSPVRRVRARRQPGLPGRGRAAHPAAADRAGRPAVARAHSRLGWHWWPDSNAILSVASAGRHPCVQRGTCAQGCNEGAKATTDITHWPGAWRPGRS